jgi:tRNA A-37 threonylcarbamoyl transferase component Bud32
MPLAIGARLGPYEVVAPLGAGGMGEVYKARDTRLLRTVALKVLRSDQPRRGERFAREAQALSRLSHPHICTIHDVGEQDGSAYLVMEYIDGQTLADRLDDGALPLDTALLYAIQIADALTEAHRQGLVHRDLKPSNVMLTRDGAKVLDFGLAKLVHGVEEPVTTESVALTGDGQVVGTVPYMSPEQLEGKTVDARTDLFALGAVLFEMVTGRRAFAGDSKARVMAAVLTQDPPALTVLQPLAGAALERVVARCLAKDVLDRWQTARDLSAELRWIREGGATSPGAVAPAGHRRGAWVASAALGALLASAAVLAVVKRAPPPPTSPSFTQVTFRRGHILPGRFAPDGHTIVYGAAWEGRPHELFSTRSGSTESRRMDLDLARLASISRSGELAVIVGLATEATLARVPMEGGAPRELMEEVLGADWLPDGSDLAVVKIVRRPGQRAMMGVEFPIGHSVLETLDRVQLIRVSPDGRRVALGGGDSDGATVSVVDRSGSRTVLSRGWRRISGLDWSPGGDEIWFSGARDDEPGRVPAVWAVSMEGAERLVARAAVEYELHDVLADGRVLLAANHTRAGLRCRSAGHDTERELGWLTYSLIEDMSTDGRTLLFAAGPVGRGPLDAPASAYLRGVDDAAAVRLDGGYPHALSPKGDLALVASADRKAWSLLPTRAGRPRLLPSGTITALVTGDWLDEDRLVLWGREGAMGVRAFVQDLRDGSLRPVTPGGMRWTQDPVVTPDGTAILGATRPDRQWRSYPLAGGEARALPFLTWADEPLGWSADGGSLYVVHRDEKATEVSVEIHGLDATTGRRELFKTLAPPDLAGVQWIDRVVLSPAADAYCYSYSQTFADLFVAEGLK